MKSNKNVRYLIGKGLSNKTVSTLSESQIKILVEKFKKENKEQTQVVTQVYDSKNPEEVKKLNQALQDPASLQGKIVQVKETEMTEDETNNVTSANALGKDAEQSYTGQGSPHDANDMADDGMDDDSGNNRSLMGVAESTINEKFESKAQQNFFWAKCNTSRGVKKKKWCELAREFSDSTSKKDYKKMPEKLHPEKTVNYKKEKTNENLEKFLEKKIVSILENKVKPRMKKSDLVKLVKEKSESMILKNPKKVTMFSDEAPKPIRPKKK